MSSESTFLQLEDVSKEFASVLGAPPLRILDHIHLEIEKGASVAIIGPSGSGKSTLLNIIGTLDKPTSGKVLLDNQDLCSLNENELADVRNRKIGFVFQHHHLLPQCTVFENVMIPTLARHEPGWQEQAQERGLRLLKRVGLGERLEHRPGQISGGERQRAAVVRALINHPTLLLADEPTGALDRSAAEELTRLLIELNREEQTTLIVVTHAPDLAAKMSRQFRLSDGRLDV